MYKEKIIDLVTGQEILRDYTSAEIAAVKRAQIETAERIAKEEQDALAKAALLEKLGITQEEAKLLLS